MNIADIYEYKELLSKLIAQDQKAGAKSRLARSLGCQPAYLSRVLTDQADLNVDQVARAARHFFLSELESEYWIYLLLENRSEQAGAKALFKKKLAQLRQQMNQLQNRLEVPQDKVPKEFLATYYSSWLLPTLHMAVRIPHLQKISALASSLRISREECETAITQLSQMGFVSIKNGKISPTDKNIHLGIDSPWVNRHHANWRIKTLERLTRGDLSGLHYSSAISCSEEDLEKIYELFVKTIKKARSIVKTSADEAVAHYAIDFFKVVN